MPRGTQTDAANAAVIVTRVSTCVQAEEGTSLEEQLEMCRIKAQALGVPVYAEYEDGGVSGSFLASREGMQSGIADIRAGRATLLIVPNMDRYSRDVEHQQRIKKDVRAAGGRVVFCNMEFDDTPEGDLAFGIMGNFAQYEKQRFRVRSMGGKRQRAKQGVQPARTFSPFGYHIVTKKDVLLGLHPGELIGKYLVVEAEAAIVRRIFIRYAEGVSLSQLCCELQTDGIPTPRRAEYWARPTLHRILNNPVYKGTPAYGRTQAFMDESRVQKGLHPDFVIPTDESRWVYLTAPALVTEDLWVLCQQRLADGVPHRAGNPRRIHFLSTILRCPRCGKGMRGKWIKRTSKSGPTRHDHYYACRDCSPSCNAARHVCNPKFYDAAPLERLTCEGLRRVARHPSLIERALSAFDQSRGQHAPEGEVERLTQSLKELDARERATAQAQIEALQVGASTAPYLAAFREIAQRRDETRVRLNRYRAAETDSATGDAERLAAVLSAVDTALIAEELTPAERRALLQPVVEYIVPREDEIDEPGVLITLKAPVVGGDTRGINQMIYKVNTAFPTWRKDFPEIADVHSQVLQNISLRVELAFSAFFRRMKAGETPGSPRVKGHGYDSFCYPGSSVGYAVVNGGLRLSKITEPNSTIQMRLHRPLVGRVKTCCIHRVGSKWFVCFSVEQGEDFLPPCTDTIGLDAGLNSFLALSNGEFIDNPRFFRKEEKALAKAGRRQAKTKKPSKERKKANKVLSRIHERVRNRRHDFVHQTARRIVNRFGVIAVEKLNVRGMMQNHCLAESIGDAAWSMFRTVLTSKADTK